MVFCHGDYHRMSKVSKLVDKLSDLQLVYTTEPFRKDFDGTILDRSRTVLTPVILSIANWSIALFLMNNQHVAKTPLPMKTHPVNWFNS